MRVTTALDIQNSIQYNKVSTYNPTINFIFLPNSGDEAKNKLTVERNLSDAHSGNRVKYYKTKG
jgi:hypothetical protein